MRKGAPNLKCIALSAYKSNKYIFGHQKFKYTISKHMHPHSYTHTRAHIHAPWHTQAPQGRGTEEKVFKKRKVFREDLKELTEDA